MRRLKDNNKIIKDNLGAWSYTLSHRYELLGGLKDKDLEFTPTQSKKFKDLQYQFACIGLTQLSYAKMLREGRFSSKYFSIFETELTKLRNKRELMAKLKEIDKEFKKEILKYSDKDTFLWEDIKIPVWRIITFLQEHERLHHGQLISYFTLAGLKFPSQFKKDWNL